MSKTRRDFAIAAQARRTARYRPFYGASEYIRDRLRSERQSRIAYTARRIKQRVDQAQEAYHKQLLIRRLMASLRVALSRHQD